MLRRILVGTLGGMALLTPIVQAQTPIKPGLNVINRSTVAIRELYATDSGAANWGNNRLGKTPVRGRSKQFVQLLGDYNCLYDVRVIFEDKRVEERKQVNICARDTVVFGEAKNVSAPRGAR